MAARSEPPKHIHTEKYFCFSCASIAVRSHEVILRKIWYTFVKFMIFKTLQIGYSSSIPNTSSKSSLLSDDSESSENEETLASMKTKPVIKKTMFIYNPDNENQTSKQNGTVHFLIDNIPYIDIELISKMIKTMSNVIQKEEPDIKKKIKCCVDSYIPIIVIDDIIVYNQPTLVNGQQIKSIALQIKASIIPHQKQKTTFTMSRLHFATDNIISEIMHVTYSPELNLEIASSDVHQLTGIVKTLFTDDNFGDILSHEIAIIRCVDKRYINRKDHALSTHCENILKTCDVVFIIEDYATLYMSSFIDKYMKLFIDDNHVHKQSISWKMTFIGMEHDVKNKYAINDNVVIAFNYVREKDSFIDRDTSKKHARASDEDVSSSSNGKTNKRTR